MGSDTHILENLFKENRHTYTDTSHGNVNCCKNSGG